MFPIDSYVGCDPILKASIKVVEEERTKCYLLLWTRGCVRYLDR